MRGQHLPVKLRLGMNYRPDILGSKMDYLIHGSGKWGHVYVFYSLGVGPKGPTLVRFPCHLKKRVGP